MLSLLPALLAQAAKTGGKTKGPPPVKDAWYYIDAVNEWLKHPDFDAAMASPYFWGGSIVAMVLALFRGWKLVLFGYPLVIVMWGVVDRFILKSTTGGAQDSNVLVFAGLTVGVAGIGIYFLLIRD